MGVHVGPPLMTPKIDEWLSVWLKILTMVIWIQISFYQGIRTIHGENIIHVAAQGQLWIWREHCKLETSRHNMLMNVEIM